MPRRAWQRFVGLLLAGSVWAAACDTAEPASSARQTPVAATHPTPSEQHGTTLRWAVQEPQGIVPPEVVDASGLLIVDALFDSLTSLAPDSSVLPAAAVSWRHARRGRVWRFTLREGARFHDGTPVTAEDFVVAWTATVAGGKTGAHLQDIAGYRQLRNGGTSRLAGVRAADDSTLEVRLAAPRMDFAAVVAHPSLGPVPAGLWHDDQAALARQPVGNGPFQMAEPWSHQQFIRVARFDDWHNGERSSSPGRLTEVLFRTLDPDSGYVAFQQGRVDVTTVPAGALEQARSEYGTSPDGYRGPGVVDGGLPSLYYIGFRTDRPPFDDAEVRRAISRAIDRNALIEPRPDEDIDVARRLVPSVISRLGNVSCRACIHIPSLAESVLGQAGLTEVMYWFDADGGHEQVAQQIRADLASVGVRVRFRQLSFDSYLEALERGEPEMFRFGWQAQGPTPDAMLYPLLHSGAPREPGDGANYTGYASDEVDELLDAARAAVSDRERDRLWARAEAVALDDHPISPLFSFRNRLVVGQRVGGLVISPWGTATLERAEILPERATESP